jgi:hypothetical protein
MWKGYRRGAMHDEPHAAWPPAKDRMDRCGLLLDCAPAGRPVRCISLRQLSRAGKLRAGSRFVSHLANFITQRLVSPYDSSSVSNKLRRKRWQELAAAFPQLPDMHVLDIGGDARAWRTSGLRPAHVTLLNLTSQDVEEPWMTAVVGDACEPLEGVPKADLAYSNSVIEHVGGHWRRARFAEGIRGAASHYWVQTPYRYFPIEPHFLFPGLQFLPKAAQSAAIAKWPVGNYRSIRQRGRALECAMSLELLSASELSIYFPDARIGREKVMGLTKSIIAIQ